MIHSDIRHSRSLSEKLISLKRAALAKGVGEDTLEHVRAVMRSKGLDDSEIAAFEFADLRLFADLDDASEAVHTAAAAGTPSEVTIALAERDGYCLNCVRHYYADSAETFRRLARDKC